MTRWVDASPAHLEAWVRRHRWISPPPLYAYAPGVWLATLSGASPQGEPGRS